MTPERWKQIKALFQQAVDRTPAERASFLDAACGAGGVRATVERMLAAHDAEKPFLAGPPPVSAGWLDTAPEATIPHDPRVGVAPPLEAGAVVEGRYRIEGLIGQGGMGSVYRATHLLLDRSVALKILRPSAAGAAGADRFEREARLVAHLRHPHIVTIHDFGLAPDVGLYLVMELLVGRTLGAELASSGPLDPGRALAIMLQVCSAVHAAHGAGVVHRDLKPENIFLEAAGGDHAKVLDFGIAKLREEASPAITLTGSVIGTPVYMSPEQCLSEEVDVRSDVYALGCVLYEMLVGRPPFLADTVAALLVKHVTEAAPLDALEGGGIPAGVVDAVGRALAKEPGARFESVREFAAALEAGGGGLGPARPRGARAPIAPARVSTDPTARPAATGGLAAPNNLPPQMTSFVGRERQVAQLRRLVSLSRLVTLAGIGGVGKTRLALQTAPGLLDACPDGVWLVELAALGDGGLVEQVVATAVGAREEPGGAQPNALVEFLRGRRALLILDNCEHLVDACAALAGRLLRECPDLRILATSREALNIHGETVWHVPPLALPGDGAAVDEVTQCEAVRLFVERASLSRPDFALTETRAAAVGELCRRLEGIPLAIELAAARVKALSVEQILERLDDRFRLLTGGSRTAQPRQQTLRAAIDWSHDLLTPDEQLLFRRLSVFAGGWTLEAAESVCAGVSSGSGGQGAGGRGEVRDGGGVARGQEEAGRVDPGSASSLTPDPWPLTPDDVLDLLARLVDKSLVTASEQGGGTRYAMLETIREYARERLVEAGEGQSFLARHRDWFLRFAEAAEPQLQGARQSAWFARLEADHDNLRAVLARCESEWPGGDTALRLCCAMRYFWYVHGHTAEGRRWVEAALAAGGGAPPELRATAHYGAGGLALAQADYEAAEAHLRQSLQLYQASGNTYGAIHVLLRLAFLYEGRGDYDDTVAVARESLALSRAEERRNEVALAQYYIGRVALGRGDLDLASACFEEGLAVHREAGNRRYVAIMLHSLGELGRAEGALGECMAITRELGDTRLLADALTVLGSVANDGGDHERALAIHREALAIHQNRADLGGVAFALGGIACAMAGSGRPRDALTLAAAASRLHEEVKSPPSPAEQADLDRHLGPARAALGPEEAARALAEGRALDYDAAIRRALTPP